MIYDFECGHCKKVFGINLPVDLAGSVMHCSFCGKEMRRLYYPPRLLGRQKPGSFANKPKAHWNAMDSKLAALKLAESKGTDHLREAYRGFGSTAKMVLDYKKKEYAS